MYGTTWWFYAEDATLGRASDDREAGQYLWNRQNGTPSARAPRSPPGFLPVFWISYARLLVNEVSLFEDLLDAIEPIKRPRGRPRTRPAKVHADTAYEAEHCRQYLRRRGIGCRIARKGIESRERLGRYRWVVERSQAWLSRFRRLDVRYERQAAIHQAFLDLGCALICWNFLS
jgi:transposase